MQKLFILSRYKEDYDWIKEYTDHYLIYNKGEAIWNDNHILNMKNIGGNQRDIFDFIYSMYDDLPDVIVFTQSYPFDHVPKDKFDELIQRNCLTSLEFYGMIPNNSMEGRTPEGNFLEVNNSWYIHAHNETYSLTCKYVSLDEFMNKYFTDYTHLNYIPFAPGSQYVIPKETALQYSKKFWGSLMNELPEHNMTEGHIIERALLLILKGEYGVKPEYQ